MTTNSNPPIAEYLEDGTSRTHPVPFKFDTADALLVQRLLPDISIKLVLGVDYTVGGVGNPQGGTILKSSGGIAGARLSITRQTPRIQSMSYTANDTFPADSHEKALDRQMLISQELDVAIADISGRALRVPPGEKIGQLPSKEVRKQKLLGFSSTGAIALYDIDTTIGLPPVIINKPVDLYDFAELREEGETDQDAFNRITESGIVRLWFWRGKGRTDGQYNIYCGPWTNADIFDPTSPNYIPGATNDMLIEARGNLRTGMVIKGNNAELLQGEGNYLFMGNALGGPNLKNIRIEGVTLIGNSPAYSGASQNAHLVALFGVTRFHAEGVLFKNSPGDSVYAARGPKLNSTGHNVDATVTYCEVDGSGGPSRNPFTHEDCVGWHITFNYVHDTTTNGEPGSFDTEPVIVDGVIPAGSFVGTNIARVGRVNYSNNRFERCKGVIFALQYDVRLTLDYGGMYTVSKNIVEDCFSFIDVVGPPDDQNNVTRSFAAKVSGNIVRRLTGPIGRIGGGLGVEIVDNTFEDVDFMRFGYGWGNRYVYIRRNTFIRAGKTNGFVFIASLDCQYVMIEDNDFISCGRTDRLGANAVLLTQDGADEYGPDKTGTPKPRSIGISLDRNRVYNTFSDGQPGVLSHFAIHNATGGYGPGASNVGNEFFGTPIPNGDTYSPPRPRAGKYLEIAFSNQSIPGAQNGVPGRVVIDFGMAGLTPGTNLRAYFSQFVGAASDINFRSLLDIVVRPTSSTTGVLFILNHGNANQGTGSGTKLIVEEV